MNKKRLPRKLKKKLKKSGKYLPFPWISIKSNLTSEEIEHFAKQWQEALKEQPYMIFCDPANEDGDKSEISFWDTRTGKQITEKQTKLFADMDKIKQTYSGIASIEKLPEFNPKQERIEEFKKHWQENSIKYINPHPLIINSIP